MILYENSDLEEAMNAVKEELFKDLSESVINENTKKQSPLDTND